MTRFDPKSGWLGRRGGRGTAAVILALACAGSTALANVRPAVDVCLLQLAAIGGVDRHGLWWIPKAQLARLELGAEVTDNFGITAGVALGDVWALFPSGLPLSARAYWDFTPNELWVRRTAYVTASYQRDVFDPFRMSSSSFVVFGLGATYTYYAITTRAELLVPAARTPYVALLIGFELGGSYIFGRHHDPDAGDWYQ
jgi:hypothetical protein